MRFLRFFVLFLVASLIVYMALSLTSPLQGIKLWLAGAVLATPYLAIIVVILRRSRQRSGSQWLGRCFELLAFVGMAYLSFLLVFTLLRDITSVFLNYPLHTVRMSELIAGASLVALLLGFVGARVAIRVKTVHIPIKDLAPALEGFRIVQLSDVHISSSIGRLFVRKIVQMANSCQPDVVVLTGDIADGPLESLREEAEPFSKLEARYKKFYITGNHEYYWNAQPWIERFSSLKLQALLNRHEIVRVKDSAIVFVGLPDRTASHFGMEAPNQDLALKGVPKENYPRVLLSHQTKGALEEASQNKFDLMISGHTHGGQFFPWTLVLKAVDPFPYGLKKFHDMWVYVSRGTGYWGPPVRLGSPAEVTLLILKRA